MYDAIVIGSRCAGAPTAMLLARRGRRVLVVDRATFPRDVLSGHTIQPAGMAQLARWGLLERVRATGAPFVSDIRFDFGDVVLEGSPVPVDGIDTAACVRRTILDPLLADAAAEAGAEVRHGVTVTELVRDGDRVVGIRGHDGAGRPFEERASIVVGADGVNSFVARSVDAATYQVQPATTFAVYSYWRGLDPDRLRALRAARPVLRRHPDQRRPDARGPAGPDRRRGRATTAGPPTPSPRRWPRCRASPPGSPAASGWSGSAAPARTTASSASRPGRVGRSSATPDTTRTRSRRRGCSTRSVTPSCSPGRSTTASTATSPPAMLRYQRERDAAAMPMYELTCGLADLDEPPSDEMLGLLAALEGQPAHIARFLGLIAGSVPIAEFFSPESLAAIAGTRPSRRLTTTRPHQGADMNHHPKTRMAPTEIAPDTFLIHDHHGEGDAPVAVALNSMVIRAAEPVVVDTGMAENRDHYLADVFSLVEPDDIRWVFISHDDVDHTGNVNALMAAAPNATLVVNWFMTQRMGESLEVPLTRQRWVGDGEGLDVGDRVLRGDPATGLRRPDHPRPLRPDHRRVLGVGQLRHTDADARPHRGRDRHGVLGGGHPHLRPLRQPVADLDRRRPLPGDRRPGRASSPRRSWPAATRQPSPAAALRPRSPRRGSHRRPTCPTSPTKRCSSRSSRRSRRSPPDGAVGPASARCPRPNRPVDKEPGPARTRSVGWARQHTFRRRSWVALGPDGIGAS